MEAAVNSIADVLPSEVLEKIFSYCTHEDLVQSIQDVCSHWREVVQSTSLWKNVTYCPEEGTSSEKVVEMLRISPKLQNIILKDKYDDRVLQAITDNCAELRKIEIIRIPKSDLNFIKNLQEKCPNVKHLKLPDTVLADLDKCAVVEKFTNLKVLILIGFHDSRFSINLKPVADHCRVLEHLEFLSINFKMNDLRHLLSMKKDTLHTLGVSCCNKSHECVLPVVSTCKLKSLSLYFYGHCRIHNEKIEQFGRLKTVRALAIKDLYYEESDHLKQIFENQSMGQLVRLRLQYSPHFDDDVTEVIVRNCPMLKYLSLINCNNMTDASLKILPNLTELSSLSISGNDHVTDTGILHLQDVRSLNCLRISWCWKVTKVGLVNIAKLSTLQELILEGLYLAKFPWDLIPHHMKYLRYLGIKQCKNMDLHAIEKLKTELPCLKVEITYNLVKVSEHCIPEGCL